MEKFLLCFVLLIFEGFTFGQMNIALGEWSQQTSKGKHQGFVMTDSSYVYSIDFSNNNFRNDQKLIAKVYDKKSLKFQNSFDIAPEKKDGSDIELVQIFSIRQTMVLVMVENLKSQPKEKRILLQLIRSNGLREAPIIADTLPSQQNVNEDFHVVVDKNETGFVICTNYPVSLDENQKLKITAFNPDLSQKWNKTIAFPNKEKQYIFTDWRYDGEGKLFFLSRHIIDMYQADMEFSTLSQNTYFLWGYNHAKDKLREIELSLNQRFIHEITIEQADNRWLVAGIFANDKNFHSDGVFNLILDSVWGVVSHKIHNFTEEETHNYAQFTDPKSAHKGIDEIQIIDIIRLQNGEFALIGEEFFKEIAEPNDERMSTSNFTEVLHYQNISVFWFGINGDLKGIYCIPKNQISTNDAGEYSSFAFAHKDNNIYFFFNEHSKNLAEERPNGLNPKPLSGFRKMYVKGVQINNKGVMRNKTIFGSSRRVRIKPKSGSQMLDHSVYFLAQKKRKNALLRVHFP
jgi:hypothetical protein